MSRIADAFRNARREGRAAFVPYVTAGDPSLDRTVELAFALEQAGADVLELGVPFSDPIADGPTNQRAAERALAAGATLKRVLEAVREIREQSKMAIVLFTYANPVVRFGVDRFVEHAAASGVDGVLFTDVPAEELSGFRSETDVYEVGTVLQGGDGIARLYGMSNVQAGELIEYIQSIMQSRGNGGR